MDQQKIPTILIIGAGPGGLSLAHSIQKNLNSPEKKFDVKIFDRESSPQDRWQGYHISLNSMGINALLKCLPESLIERLHEVVPEPIIDMEEHCLKVFDQKGSPLMKSPEFKFRNLNQFIKWDEPLAFIITYRDRLRDLLLEGIDVQWGKKCIGYDEDEEGVWANFEDGSRVRGNFLIGADGINSPIRKQKVPELKINHLGITHLIVDIAPNKETLDRLNVIVGKSTLKASIGNEGDVVTIFYRHVPIDPSESRYRYTMAYSYPSEKDDGDENPEQVLEDIKRRIKENRPEGELTSIILELWELARVEYENNKGDSPYKKTFKQLKKRPLRDIDPKSVKEWETTRVTLLGDAVHAMNPWFGLGINTALVDTFHLSEAFGNFNENDWKKAFHRYEKEMRNRASKNVLHTRRAALGDHVPCNTRVGIFFRNFKFKCIGMVMNATSLWKGNGLG